MTARLDDNLQAPATDDLVGDFIARWRDTGGSERANHQLFLTELCQLLGLPRPDPASGDSAEQLDAHRNSRQAEHPELTLTGMYNVLEKLRAEEPLTAKKKTIHQQGLVTLLRELHDDLDRAVFEAHGWDDLADALVGRPGATTPLPDKPAEQAEAEEELLTRLVALNSERAAEEARGHIRWLRPDYQAPEAQGEQTTADLKSETAKAAEPAPAAQGKKPWPKTIPEQVETVRALLAVGPQTTEALATQFKRKPLKGITQVLAALEVLGQARRKGDDWQSTGSF